MVMSLGFEGNQRFGRVAGRPFIPELLRNSHELAAGNRLQSRSSEGTCDKQSNNPPFTQ